MRPLFRFLGASLLVMLPLSSNAAGITSPALKVEGKTVIVKDTIVVESGQTFDGRLPNGAWTLFKADPRRLGDGSQREGQKPIFLLKPGATLTHVILDMPSADGIHLEGAPFKTTRVIDIQVRDVGEDAITVRKGHPKASFLITRCSFLRAKDKVIQVNQPGKVLVQNSYAQNFGCFIRTCGNCPDVPYDLILSDLTARNGDTLLRMTNSKARARLSNVQYADVERLTDIQGGAELKLGSVREFR